MATQAKTKRINVSEEEVAKFNELAHKWWDKTSEFKPLHDINPLRLNFIHEKINLKDAFAPKRVSLDPSNFLNNLSVAKLD
ncbi:MAG: bifunctional 3-demethylubiquinone-9 3-methyltransferase and 2-octaprenyl-6-hydroxy phenol methylase [Pseudomonadota bacterium]